MPTSESNATDPPRADATTGSSRYRTDRVDGTARTIAIRSVRASAAFDAVTDVLARTPDVRVAADLPDDLPDDPADDPTVEALHQGDERVGSRVTFATTSERATELVATTFADADEPLVSVGVDGGDAGPVRYYYRANAETIAHDGLDVSVQREPLAEYTATDPTVDADGDVPLPKQVDADVTLEASQSPRVGESVTVSARNSTTTGTDDEGDPLRIVGYEWDLDGDGTFEYQPAASGNTQGATVQVPQSGTFDDTGTHVVQVRVRATDGTTDTASVEFEVLPEQAARAAITQLEVPYELRRNVPGARLFTAAATEAIDDVDRLEWNFAYQAGPNSGKVDGDPDDSVRVIEKPDGGWTTGALEQLYEYHVTGTYTVRLTAYGEDATSTATKTIEVTETGHEQFRGELIVDPLESNQRPPELEGTVRYRLEDPAVLTTNGWQAYDGSVTWAENGEVQVADGTQSYFFEPRPYQDVRLEARLEDGDRTGSISTTIEKTNVPLRVTIDADYGGEGSEAYHRAVTEHWTNGQWESVTADTYRWIDEFGRVISESHFVNAEAARGFKVEVTYDGDTATATYQYDPPSTTPGLYDEVVPKIELANDEDEMVTIALESDVEGSENAIRELSAGLAFQDGPLLVPAGEPVTITTERTVLPAGESVLEVRWLLYRQLANRPNSVQFVREFTGRAITYSFAGPGTQVETNADTPLPAEGRAYLFMEMETTAGTFQRFSNVYAQYVDAPDWPEYSIVGYEPVPGSEAASRSTRVRLRQEATATLHATVRPRSRVDERSRSYRLRDPAHPGRPLVAVDPDDTWRRTAPNTGRGTREEA